ncbi:hypothetical protein TUMEXPCC7403_16650 [Tumidithrix helvetica PCC 7403]
MDTQMFCNCAKLEFNDLLFHKHLHRNVSIPLQSTLRQVIFISICVNFVITTMHMV